MKKTNTRTGLTLIELLIVLVILVAVAAIIIPRISGVTEQANAATTASVLSSTNEAEGRFEAQFNRIPTAWDGVLASSGSFYSKLSPKLTGQLDAAGTRLAPGQLTAMQAQSLNDAGMTGVHFQDESFAGMPSQSGRTYAPVNTSTTFCLLQLPTSSVTAASFGTYGHNVLFSDRAFAINPYRPTWNNTFVVVGFGNECSLKNNATQDAPIMATVDANLYYGRVLCVFMVPSTAVANTSDAGYFKARYIGCFGPDGTSLMDNLENYNKAQKAN